MIAAIPQDFIKNSLSYLYTVVQKLERDNIQTVEALLIHFTGEVNAGRMLNRLLFWWPKSVKETGEVYKSWRDWEAELCITRHQVYIVHYNHYLEDVGVMRRQRQTAKGNPMHYSLDASKFFDELATFLEVNVEQLLVWMTGESLPEQSEAACPGVQQGLAGQSSNRLPGSPATACQGAPQAITTETPITEETPITGENSYNKSSKIEVTSKSQPDTANNAHTGAVSQDFFNIPGMKKKSLAKLIEQYGFKRVKAMYQHAVTQKAKNIAGFVVKGLKEEWNIPKQETQPDIYDPTYYISGEYADFIDH